jgi:hypothetical protein
MKYTLILRSSIAAVTLAGANAATITTSPTAYSIVQISDFGFVPNSSVNLVFDRFDTMSGTRNLTSLVMEITYTKSGGQFSVDNESSSSATVTLTQYVSATIKAVPSSSVSLVKDDGLGSKLGYHGDPTDDGYSVLVASSSDTRVLDANEGAGDLPNVFDASGGDYYRFEPSSVTVSDSGTILDSSKYLGNDSYTLQVAATQGTDYSGISGLSVSSSPASIVGFVKVTYNFAVSPIPEPDVASLVGGIGGLLLLRRRR